MGRKQAPLLPLILAGGHHLTPGTDGHKCNAQLQKPPSVPKELLSCHVNSCE